MPTAPPVHHPAGWRSEAQRKRDSDERRKNNPEYRQRRKLYNSKAWRVARVEFLSVNPWCEQCVSEGRTNVFARHVDHIKAVVDGGAPLDPENFRGLCHSHHSQKTARLDGGFGRVRAGAEP
jgi:5-methylcytosine-specific restriction enzyme A